MIWATDGYGVHGERAAWLREGDDTKATRSKKMMTARERPA
jgi:hypothetical protein